MLPKVTEHLIQGPFHQCGYSQNSQAATGKYDELLTETKVVWTCHKVFWLSKDNSAGHSARKRRKGRQKKMWEDNIKGWTGMDFAISTRAAEDRTRWKGIVVKSSAVSQ